MWWWVREGPERRGQAHRVGVPLPRLTAGG